MPGEGDVTSLPLFCRELRILLSSIFSEKNLLGFAIFLLFLAGGCLGTVSPGQLLWSFASG
jgi:hypothetical protein